MRYAAFLLGVNIGGHKKVPMAELKQMCEGMGFGNARTLLNSGNVMFDAGRKKVETLADELEAQLEKRFGFEVGVIVRTVEDLKRFVEADPFKDVKVAKSTRLYVTFIAEKPTESLNTPLQVEDKRGGKFTILAIHDMAVFSVVESGTTDAMSMLVKMFGKKITTRNWNTILKLVK